MSKLIQLSNSSWRQPFADRKKEFHLWGSHPDVAAFCKLEDKTKRLLNIKFQDKFNIDIIDNFTITSGREVAFPKALQDKIRNIVLKNPHSYFEITILDTPDNSVRPADIRWLKNVKRNQGDGWAYDDVNCESTFLLHWPTKHRNSAATPKVGDLILLFQTPNVINGRRNRVVHMTHLVSPISEPILEDIESPNHRWCREVKLVAKANPVESIPNPGHYSFYLPNRGLTNPIVNLENKLGHSQSVTQEEIWDLFQNSFCDSSSIGLPLVNQVDEILGQLEGDKVVKEHIRQELTRRNASIVLRAKSEALKRGKGRILCECCDFDFLKVYGTHGNTFIEGHHKIHLSAGERITKISDIALVCSNCHRMLHRKNSKGKYFLVDELRRLVKNNI